MVSTSQQYVILSGPPIALNIKVPAFSKFLLSKLNAKTTSDMHNRVYMPLSGQQVNFKYAVVKFARAALVENAIGTFNGVLMDGGETFEAKKVEESVVWSPAVARGEIDKAVVGEILEL